MWTLKVPPWTRYLGKVPWQGGTWHFDLAFTIRASGALAGTCAGEIRTNTADQPDANAAKARQGWQNSQRQVPVWTPRRRLPVQATTALRPGPLVLL
jgi:hypothetical protein